MTKLVFIGAEGAPVQQQRIEPDLGQQTGQGGGKKNAVEPPIPPENGVQQQIETRRRPGAAPAAHKKPVGVPESFYREDHQGDVPARTLPWRCPVP